MPGVRDARRAGQSRAERGVPSRHSDCEPVRRRGDVSPANALVLITLIAIWTSMLVLARRDYLDVSARAPRFGWLLVAKPAIGLVLFAAFPRWKTVVGGGVLLMEAA